MQIEFKNNFYKNVNKIFWFKHKRRRKKRRRKKHLHLMFLSRSKKFTLYFLKFDSKKIKQNYKINFNSNLTQPARKVSLAIKSTKLCLLNGKPLKSLKFITEKYLFSEKSKKLFKSSIKVFPDEWLTSKSKGIRMGKGKGALKNKIYFLQKGTILFTLKYLRKKKTNIMYKKLFLLRLNLFLFFLSKRLKNKLPFFSLTLIKKI